MDTPEVLHGLQDTDFSKRMTANASANWSKVRTHRGDGKFGTDQQPGAYAPGFFLFIGIQLTNDVLSDSNLTAKALEERKINSPESIK